MSQFAAVKNPPWVRTTATGNLAQPPPPGTPLTTSILAAQATHAPSAAAAPGQLSAATVPAGTLATAAAVVAAAQTQQAQQTPAVSAAYGTGLAAITLTQSALQQGAVLQPQGIAIPASLAATTQVNSGMVVELARLPQPGVALPTSLATTQVATVSYPAPRLLAQTAQFQAPQAHTHPAAVVQPPTAVVQSQAPQQALKQRVFTGTVTKLHDNFGFVDEDVFFQISAVKGNIPKAGERVLVEAAYNPNMPFKWNATRIQVLPNQLCQVNVQPANNTRAAIAQVTPIVTTVMTAPVSVGLTIPAGVGINTPVANIGSSPAQFTNLNQAGRWQVQQEMAVIEPMGQARVNIQYENRLEGPHPWIQDIDFPDMMDNKGPRLSVMGRRHGSPPAPRRERDGRRDDRRDRYRERERYSPPPRKRSRSPRRPSRSPPRRRPRLMPRYTVQIPKISLDVSEGNVMELRKRYSNLYIPSDFCSASFLWQDAFPSHHPYSMDHPCSFHIMNKYTEPVIKSEPVPEPTDTDYRYSAKVMLLASPALKDIYKKSCALAEDAEDTKENFVHPTRLISFLVGLKGKNETVAIGGPWSPSLDGPNPDKDPSVLIRTAIRTCRALTNIDLSKCSQWYRFAEIYYRRGESTHKGRVLPTRIETVVLFLPDVWNCLPTRVEWDGLLDGYKKQLLRKLREEQQPLAANDSQEEENNELNVKREPTHFAELDPKTIKVSELKRELEARNLSSKGLKSQLIARLTKALKSELEKEGEQQMSEEENLVNEDTDEAVDEDEKKKEEDEKRQKEEKDLIMLGKKLQMPETPAVIVHPSRTAKNGKFDCTIMSLSLLLDYRQEDNKEHSFEVSLFAELFNEMMMRDFGFRIYRAFVEAPETKDEDKDKEKKKTDKKEETKYKKDDKEEYRKREETEVDSDRDEDDSDDEEYDADDKKDRERKRKKRKKLQMYTQDPYLLLSFVYYDQTHCGYLLDKDLEEIFFTLGLRLSRAQVRKLVTKVNKRETFRYRKLTDRPILDGDKANAPNSPKIKLEELAAGNKKIIPVFESMQMEVSEQESSEPKDQNLESEQRKNLVTHQGALVDVAKLLKQLDRSEKARIDIEHRLRSLEDELDGVHELASSKEKHSQKLTLDLEDRQLKLQDTEEELRRSILQNEKCRRSLSTCRDQLQAAMSIIDNTLKVKTVRSSTSRNNGTNYSKKENESNCYRPSARESSSQTTNFKSKEVSANRNSKGSSDSDEQSRNGSQPRAKIDALNCDHEVNFVDTANTD